VKILLLVSTMTGTAEMIAEDIRNAGEDLVADIVLAERADAAQVMEADHLIVVSSTYGSGEIPEPAKPLFAALDNKAASLSETRYGVVALGDRSLYSSTFANGGRHWDAMLQKKGAMRVTDMLLLDASEPDNMSDHATAWFRQWLETLSKVMA
jgi:MioC protein